MVRFGSNGSPLALSMAVCRAMLPQENPLVYLIGDPSDTKAKIPPRVTADGKAMICPVPLAFHTDLASVLNMEADMDGWHTAPLAGPTSTWPAHVLAALRHARGIKGLIQMRQLQKPEASPRGSE